MTQARLQLGLDGEDLAAAELERHGYEILERRYRTPHGEIDLVARDGECLVFVEVKTRSGAAFGDPEEAVTDSKQHRIVWMATDYLARHGLEESLCRFDVVSVAADTAPPAVTLFQDAFRPGW